MSEPVYYSDTKGNNLFGFKVENDEMLPHFRAGDLVVVNPNLPARSGDFVVAIKDSSSVLRLFVKSKTDMLTKTNNSDALPEAASLFIILGRVVERKKMY